MRTKEFRRNREDAMMRELLRNEKKNLWEKKKSKKKKRRIKPWLR